MSKASKLLEKILAPGLPEAAYPGNLGFEELVNFYDVATDSERKQLDKAIKKNNWYEFKLLIQKVLNVTLI